ncbi:MAG: hypothetical protein QOG95_5499 [Mycobacterium sp.]|jgi:hypothetical protein|nr:hypothetical protein [Mycobacterium sp.]MDT5278567.1 hypothetical protein [Mycobacterium sp.]
MAAVDLTADVPMSPQDMWDHVSDLSELGDWLVMHEGWRSELPDELSEGTQVVGVARAKGFRNRVTWTVTTWQPPHRVALSGSGKGGAKYSVMLSVSPTKQVRPWVCASSWAAVRCSARWASRRPAPSKGMSRNR